MIFLKCSQGFRRILVTPNSLQALSFGVRNRISNARKIAMSGTLVRFRWGLVSTMLIALTGCATIPPAPFPISLTSSERVQIVSVYATAAKRGVRVAGFARRRGFASSPSGSHIHVSAELVDGRLAEVDANWHPPVRHRTLIAPYQTLLRDVAMAEVKRVDVSYRNARD
jgi:hypothetical protein